MGDCAGMVVRGAVAGAIGGTLQVGLGVALRWLIPTRRDNNISPRLVNRLARASGGRWWHPSRDWIGGTLFHYAYSVGWGTVYAITRETTRRPAWQVSLALGWLLYLLAFSRVGIGTRTRTEQEPDDRSWRRQIVLLLLPTGYAGLTALVYEGLTQASQQAVETRAHALAGAH